MATQQVKILIIGGKQAQGNGLRTGQSFVEQLVRRIEQAGQRVFIEYHVPIDLHMATSILYYLNVHRYDLIVLQMGHQYLLQPFAFRSFLTYHSHKPAWLSDGSPRFVMQDIPQTTDSLALKSTISSQLGNKLKALLLKSLNAIKRIGCLRDLIFHLSDTLHYLQPYNHKVILMTPFPHQEPVSNWLRQEGRKLFKNMGNAYGMPVLDTHELIQPSDEYFLVDDPDQLSAVGHELIGSALYDVYQRMKIPHSDESSQSNPLRPRLPRGY